MPPTSPKPTNRRGKSRRGRHFVGFAGVCAALIAAPVAHADLESTTTINGAVPPGTPGKLADLTTVIDSTDKNGDRLLVQQGIRKSGTRSPIQYHGFIGNTCVLSGSVTMFAEGAAPVSHPKGSCFELPTGVAMATANLGEEDAQLTVTFVLPPNDPAIIVLEPNWSDLTDPTG